MTEIKEDHSPLLHVNSTTRDNPYYTSEFAHTGKVQYGDNINKSNLLSTMHPTTPFEDGAP